MPCHHYTAAAEVRDEAAHEETAASKVLSDAVSALQMARGGLEEAQREVGSTGAHIIHFHTYITCIFTFSLSLSLFHFHLHFYFRSLAAAAAAAAACLYLVVCCRVSLSLSLSRQPSLKAQSTPYVVYVYRVLYDAKKNTHEYMGTGMDHG